MALGTVLTVYTDVVVCGRDHEVTLTTDGTRVLIEAEVHASEPAVTREGTVFSMDCPVLDRDGNACGQRIEWDIIENVWKPDSLAITWLEEYGWKAEVAGC